MLYVISYFLLMRTTTPAIGDNGQPIFSSGYIFASPHRIEGDLSVYGPSVSGANYFFLPIDMAWRKVKGLTPSRWDLEEELKQRGANKAFQAIGDKSPQPER